MGKSKNKQSLKKWLQIILTPIFLLAVWGVFTLLFITSYDKSFLILSYFHSKNNFTSINYDKLLSGDKVSGEFTAADNNLGIVVVRFTIFSRVAYKDEDVIAFRMKEKGSKQWYYQSNYRAGLIYDVPLFPFGFPKIADSKGKTYDFELQSLKGNQKNAVAISNHEPILISKYEPSKAALLSDKKDFVYFILKKFNALKTPEVLFVSIIFLLPLISYFLLLTPSGKRISQAFNKYLAERMPVQINQKSEKFFYLTYLEIFLLSVLLIIILSNIFIFQITYAAIYLFLIGVWIYILINNTNDKISYVVAMAFLALSFVLYYCYFEHLAEIAASWSFLFLLAGIIQTVSKYRKRK